MQNKVLIREIFDKDFDPTHKMGNLAEYKIRRSARGMLIDVDKVALLDVTKHKYHKLPGGGVDGDESIEDGFKREVLEEVGCACEILDQGGVIIEWRDGFKLLQINYVFLARVVGEVGKNKLEQGEIDDGFVLEWVPIEKVEEILDKDVTKDYEGKFIQIRDRSIVEFYKDKLKR